MEPTPTRRHRGFTLVELLVVIGIIALLISILLPSLNKARRAANTVKCSANLHGIMLAFQIYGSQNHDYFPGSTLTTGFGCGSTAYSETYCPDVSGLCDWQTPVLNAEGVKIPYSTGADDGRANPQARLDRVSYGFNNQSFHDPENDVQGLLFSGPTDFAGASNIPVTLPWGSYSTSYVFMVGNPTVTEPATYNTQANVTKFLLNAYDFPSATYAPKFAKVGMAAKKVCISDGARYASFSGTSTLIDMSFGYQTTTGGAYSDYGPWSSYANGHQRQHATANEAVKPVAGLDERPLWARHGNRVGNGAPDSYKFNAAFFDGHVETLGDYQGSDPNLWGPKGGTLAIGDMEPDTRARLGITTTSGNYIIPY